MHHCMVDGTAAVQLGNLLLDADPDAGDAEPQAYTPAPTPSSADRLARAVIDRTGDLAALALTPVRLATAPHRLPGAARGVRTGARTVLPPAPGSPLNQPVSAQRHHMRVTRSLDEIRTLRRHFGVRPNDVLLAAATGALRQFFEERGERPLRLKAMVPADVRSSGDADATGNRISFVFLELPRDEPDPVERLRLVHRATATRDEDETAEALDYAFRTLARTPGPVQSALAHAFAHPRLFNLTVSSVAGPAVTRYLHGCRLRAVHSAVPLAGRHALSIGVVTVAGNACVGLTANPAALPDAEVIASGYDAALDELLTRAGGSP